jgi:hypothetical protein
MVDGQPRRHGGQVRLRRFDLGAGRQRPMPPQERLLHDVLGLRDAAEHPVGDREQQRPQLLGELAHIVHVCLVPFHADHEDV